MLFKISLKKDQLEIREAKRIRQRGGTRRDFRCTVYIDDRYLAGQLCVIPLYQIRLYIHLPFSLKRHLRPSCMATADIVRLIVRYGAR